MTATLVSVLSKFTGVKRSGANWKALCPAHADRNPSLSISEKDGRILIRCMTGCVTEDVCKAAGIKIRELFVADRNEDATLQQDCIGATLTLAQYARAKQLPVEFLKRLKLSDIRYQGGSAVRIPYLDERSAEIAVRFRLAMEKSPDGENRFRWKKGAKPQLYGLWRKQETDYVVLCEGESDCHTLWYHGFPALGVPGATNWNENRDAAHLDSFARIYVVIEPDRGGMAVRDWLAKSRICDRAHLLNLNEFKDPSALHLNDPTHFVDRFREAMKASVQLSRVQADQLIAEKAEAWRLCHHLAQSTSVLDRFGEAIRVRGVVGEERTAKSLYLALVTRFLPRPVSVAIKGPSSGGKSFVTEQVLQFFPESAVYCLTGMSERVLAYTEATLSNRFLVIFEAEGLSSDFGSYLIRSLLSEGRLIYETVEKTTEGFKPRRIEKEGPTGLIVTTTAVRLHPENETRLLSLHVADTQTQTKAVLLALAQNPREQGDLTSWKALQIWLEHSEHRVVIPFAIQLAELVPAVSVRLRRDFGAVLALVKAHAILHQMSRQRDAEGAIVATLDDYGAVHDLIGPIVSEGVGATVVSSIRETVEAVRFLLESETDVSLAKTAKYLKLDKSATSRRVTAAVQQGYLENLEDRKGRPARIVLGDPLPTELEVLPTVEALQCCCDDTGGYIPLPTQQVTTATADTIPARQTQRIIEVEI